MKRILGLAVCLAMLITMFSGCSAPSSVAATTVATQAASPTETVAATPLATEKPKPVTFTMFRSTANPGQDLDSSTPVSKKVQEITGVTIDWQFPTGDFTEKVSLMAASGDLTDMMYCQEASKILYDAKSVIQLDDYISKFGQDVKRLYGDDVLKMARWSLDDPHNYFLPTGGVKELPLTNQDNDNGFLLQLAACKALNYPKIKTLADFESAIKTFYAQNPMIDGQPAIPYSLCFDDWNGIFSILNPIGSVCGDNGDDGEYRVDLTTRQATFRYTLPEYKEGYRWLNHMNDIGLLDPESFVQKFDQYQAKIASGRVIACNDVVSWHINSAIDSLKAAGKADRAYAIFAPSLDGKIVYNGNARGMWTSRDGVMISTKCKDPERAFKFLDWLCTDEAQILNHWGIEGVDYTIQNGKRTWTDDYYNRDTNAQGDFHKATGITNFGWPFPERARGSLDPNGDYYLPYYDDARIFATKTPAEQEVLNGYGIKLWKQFLPDPSKVPTNPWGYGWTISLPTDSKGAIAETACMDVVHRDIPKLVLCKPAEFDAQWDAFQKDLTDAGVADANAAKTAEIDKIYKLYND